MGYAVSGSFAGNLKFVLAPKTKRFWNLFFSKMSDFFNAIEFQRLKNAISVTDNHCLNYVRRRNSVSSDDIILTIHITYDCLRRWYEEKKEGALKDVDCKYCEILNVFLAEKYSLK